MINKYAIKDSFRKNLRRYILQAYRTIPIIQNPYILDLGCGAGESSILLSEIPNTIIYAVDSDAEIIDWFREKVKTIENAAQINILNKSVFELDFQDQKFDIIWAEGLFNIIGFETGLKLADKHIKNDGFLVIHDESVSKKEKLSIIKENGYNLIHSIKLSENVWWEGYYSPMERFLQSENIENMQLIFKNELLEIERCKMKPDEFSSIYYILKKTSK